MQFFHQQVETTKVAEVCSITPNVLHGYLKRGLIVRHRDTGVVTGGGKRGMRKHFTFYNVMEVALARELIDVGVGGGDPVAAFQAAQNFAHVSSDDGGTPAIERLPGLPFPPSLGVTLLAIGGGRSWDLVASPGREDGTYFKLKHQLGTGSFVIIDASAVFNRVATGLGYEPRTVLRDAYGAETE